MTKSSEKATKVDGCSIVCFGCCFTATRCPPDVQSLPALGEKVPIFSGEKQKTAAAFINNIRVHCVAVNTGDDKITKAVRGTCALQVILQSSVHPRYCQHW